MLVARVFPRRTNATPRDPLSFYPTDPAGENYTLAAPGLIPPEVDAVHVSVTFTWDLKAAEWLAEAWKHVAPVSIGGPATGMRGGEFVPGMFVKRGYTITSRGCPNKCWFCSVWKRDGNVRELPITEGYNVLDDNLLACSYRHVCAVIDMLRRQKMGRPEFTGGIEPARVGQTYAEALASVRPKRLFLAYDTPDDWWYVERAAGLLWKAGFTKASHTVACYVLCGWPKDSMEAAEKRMRDVLGLGVFPMAMLWRGNDGKLDPAWRQFQRQWARQHIVATKMRDAA